MQDKEEIISPDPFFESCGMRVLTALRRIIRAVDLHSRRLYAEHQVTTPQMICLYSLVRAGRTTQSKLAAEVNLSMSTINGIIDRLETRKLVKRRRDNSDRRRVWLEVTESGRKLAESAPILLQDRLSNALRRLPVLEQAAIALSLERVVALIRAEGIDASPNLVPDGQLTERGEEASP
ncbi:MAG TPA: MarR family transcriptional regulator [candidate division Zixibacteria bacterium]|nr:MarR family transcriptional regulator [candidate division Zixibacteria bacterium]